MLSFEDYQRMNATTTINVGQQIKEQSDMVMQDTWYNDVQTRTCYLYDYYHDNELDKMGEYIPNTDSGKIKVDLKFIVKEYKSISKDDPEYHIQFPPDFINNVVMPEWWDRYRKLGVKDFIGLYIDIPDDRGVYWKWFIETSEVANQFPKYGVLKCNYRFQWITDNGVNRYKRQMWGAERTQSSYTSGTWTGNVITKYDEQGKFWIPWNPITGELVHDQRIIISMLQKKPFVYKISKIKNTAPKGIIAVTLEQKEFDEHTDYVNLETGEMYADYYAKSTEVIEENPNPDTVISDKMTLSCTLAVIKVGGTFKTITSTVADKDGNDVTANYNDFKWSYFIEDKDVSDLIAISTTVVAANKTKIKFLGGSEYLNKSLVVKCKSDLLSCELQLDIVAL